MDHTTPSALAGKWWFNRASLLLGRCPSHVTYTHLQCISLNVICELDEMSGSTPQTVIHTPFNMRWSREFEIIKKRKPATRKKEIKRKNIKALNRRQRTTFGTSRKMMILLCKVATGPVPGPCHTCVMSHIWMSGTTGTNKSWAMYEPTKSHIWRSMSHTSTSHIIRMNDSFHTGKSHVTYINESCHTCVMSQLWMRARGLSHVPMCLSQYSIHITPPSARIVYTCMYMCIDVSRDYLRQHYNICIYISLSLFAWMLYICLYMYMYVYVYMYIYVYVCINICICIRMRIYMYTHVYISKLVTYFQIGYGMCVSWYGIKIKSHNYLRECFPMVCLESSRLHHYHMCTPPHTLHRLYLPVLLLSANVYVYHIA
jgi:hypothetical protein